MHNDSTDVVLPNDSFDVYSLFSWHLSHQCVPDEVIDNALDEVCVRHKTQYGGTVGCGVKVNEKNGESESLWSRCDSKAKALH